MTALIREGIDNGKFKNGNLVNTIHTLYIYQIIQFLMNPSFALNRNTATKIVKTFLNRVGANG